MTDPVAPRRKYYQEDLAKYFLVEHIENSFIDPDILPFLEKHDITKDPEFLDDNVKRRVELHSHFLDHGFSEDRRIYAAFASPETGFGAFADIFIPAWTVIGEYKGIITNKNMNTDYAWIYHSKPKDAAGNPLKLRINARTSGNLTRFVNHSEYPNCSVIHIPYKNRWRTVYITNTNIMPDQELSVYYGDTYWAERKNKVEN